LQIRTAPARASTGCAASDSPWIALAPPATSRQTSSPLSPPRAAGSGWCNRRPAGGGCRRPPAVRCARGACSLPDRALTAAVPGRSARCEQAPERSGIEADVCATAGAAAVTLNVTSNRKSRRTFMPPSGHMRLPPSIECIPCLREARPTGHDLAGSRRKIESCAGE
jgi:hypothetical protein